MLARGDRQFAISNTEKPVRMIKVKGRGGKLTTDVRFSNELLKFRSVSDIDAISGDNIIGFMNGDVGFMYRVSGYTSLAIVDEEMAQVIDNIAKWNNALQYGSGWSLITTYSNQRIVNQDAHLRQVANEWNERGGAPKAIRELIKTHHRDLKVVHTRHKSSQQYLLIRATSIDTLMLEVKQLEDSVRIGMLKSIEMMTGDEALQIIRRVQYGEE